jgi:hypothetical protein
VPPFDKICPLIIAQKNKKDKNSLFLKENLEKN